jgi:hypothetical protein
MIESASGVLNSTSSREAATCATSFSARKLAAEKVKLPTGFAAPSPTQYVAGAVTSAVTLA